MSKVMLLISTIQRESTHMQVKCTVPHRDGVESISVTDRIFSHPGELENALIAAGVSQQDACAPFHVINNGLPTFIPVSTEVARKLGLLE